MEPLINCILHDDEFLPKLGNLQIGTTATQKTIKTGMIEGDTGVFEVKIERFEFRVTNAEV
jgi:hypothetical protein